MRSGSRKKYRATAEDACPLGYLSKEECEAQKQEAVRKAHIDKVKLEMAKHEAATREAARVAALAGKTYIRPMGPWEIAG